MGILLCVRWKHLYHKKRRMNGNGITCWCLWEMKRKFRIVMYISFSVVNRIHVFTYLYCGEEFLLYYGPTFEHHISITWIFQCYLHSLWLKKCFLMSFLTFILYGFLLHHPILESNHISKNRSVLMSLWPFRNLNIIMPSFILLSSSVERLRTYFLFRNSFHLLLTLSLLQSVRPAPSCLCVSVS